MAAIILGALLLAAALVIYVSTDRLQGFGGLPSPADAERFKASPEYVRGRFVDAEPTKVWKSGSTIKLTREFLIGKQQRRPRCPLPMVNPAEPLKAAPKSGLRITWLGHSTTLIEIDGQTILTDPIWSDLASPSTVTGTSRFHPPPLAIEDLPHVDAVVISHDHYDHLDMKTIRVLAARGVTFHVGLGVGAHLAVWGVPPERIVEHDWWQSARLPGGVEVISTPARHFSGRLPFLSNRTLWSSWALVGPHHRVFFSGDTGLTAALEKVGDRYGPFDVALLEIGQYHPNWGDIHLGPHGALTTFAMLKAKRLLPIHWSTFRLGLHGWSQPAEDLAVEAENSGVPLLTPLLGEPIEPAENPITGPWWRALPPMVKDCP
jgi:L-ascorbate metabolism protein UlaG (beta-lactamase superfamily)